MVTRYYICDECDYHFVTEQKIHAPLKKKCPECGKKKLYQDLTGQHSFVYQEPKTLGHLAERNTERAGKYELEAERAKHKKIKSEGKPKWYNPDKVDLTKALGDLTPEKQADYIMKGET